MQDIALTNFLEGEIWITVKREKYRIVSVERDNPLCWYPLLLENVQSKLLFTADSNGLIHSDFRCIDDKLVMKVSADFEISKTEKDLADRMLKVYNKRKQMMEEDRRKKNDSIVRRWRLNPKKK